MTSSVWQRSIAILLIFSTFFVAQGMAQSPGVPDEHYNLPLRFDVIGDGVEQLPLELSYDLESSKGSELQMDSLVFNPDTTGLKILNFAKQDFLAFFYPKELFNQPMVEAISRTGRVLWSQVILKKNQDQWGNRVSTWNEKSKEKADLFNAVFAIGAKEGVHSLWGVREAFKICFTEQDGNYAGLVGQTRVCSPLYEIRKSRNYNLQLYPLSQTPARVILQNESAALKQTKAVDLGKPVQFYAELSTGMTVEFLAIPRKLRVVEMLELSNGGVSMMGEGVRPLQAFRKFERAAIAKWMEYIGWVDTIGDLREFWELNLDRDNPQVMISGTGGGIFRQRFIITKLPTESMRPYLAKDTPTGTYVDGTDLFGRVPAGVKIATQQNALQMENLDPQAFTWQFAATKRGLMNRSVVNVEKDGKTSKAFYEAYKGHPREFSFRGTLLMDFAKKIVPVSELAFNYWFENLAGWDNELLSRQRWGLSIKAWQSMSPFELNNLKSTMQSSTLDLKYRLNQGLWARDESWGGLLTMQDFKYSGYNYRALGGGFFWARSMPKVFDEAMNLLPFMRYPKWVDLEFAYYTSSLNSNVTLKTTGNWSLNFHGKVMWTKTFFGEAGFGIKSYYYDVRYPEGVFGTDGQALRKETVQFLIPYATAGLGMSF